MVKVAAVPCRLHGAPRGRPAHRMSEQTLVAGDIGTQCVADSLATVVPYPYRLPSPNEFVMTISDSPPLYARSVDALKALLQGEVAAEETYREAAAKVDDERSAKIHDNWDCHANRIPVLTRRITELGGTPTSTPGMWRSVERLIERGADMFSKDDVVLALESGEDQGLENYRAAMQELDPVSQQLIRKDLLPAQERTHRVMHAMKHASSVAPQHPRA